jgi:hypothetical protein
MERTLLDWGGKTIAGIPVFQEAMDIRGIVWIPLIQILVLFVQVRILVG